MNELGYFIVVYWPLLAGGAVLYALSVIVVTIFSACRRG